MLLSGCASSGGGSGLSGGLPADCLFNRAISDYERLDDRNLILHGPGSDAYHVVLATPSSNIDGEFEIGVYDRDGDGRVCPFGGDAIIIDGPIVETIPLRSIERINADDVEFLKIEYGLIKVEDGAVTVTVIE